MSLALILLLFACGDKDGAVSDRDGDGSPDDEDCDDTRADIHPGATEVCDGLDNDCDDLVDDADPDRDGTSGRLFYRDGDFDGYGDPDDSQAACAAPAGYTDDATDCDDGDPERNPSAREVCDGVDNDCNDQVDEGAGAVVGYLDGDGDGYGSDDTALSGCELPAGRVAQGGDCDDDDPAVFPGAAELCNGADDDCDGQVDLAGAVAFQAASGEWTDVSSTFASGGRISLDLDGTLWFCDGTYRVNLDLTADVDLRGLPSSEGAVVLDGRGLGTVVEIKAGTATTSVVDLVLQNGSGEGLDDTFSGRGGGGLSCEGGADVRLEGVQVTSNSAQYGAGIGVVGCDLTIADSVVLSNSATYYGGGLLLNDGAFRLERVRVEKNQASQSIGGLYAGEYNGVDTSLEVVDTSFSGNSDLYTAGGIYVYAAKTTVESTSPGATSFASNTSTYGASVAYIYSDGVSFTDVDFGSTGASDDNGVPEIYTGYYGYPYVVDGRSSFSCNAERCGSSTSYALGSSTSSANLAGRAYGNIIRADSYATIDAFSVYLGVGSYCSADLYLLSTSTDPTVDSGPLTWTIEWSDTGNTVRGTGWVSGDYLGVLAQPGRWYAFVVAEYCVGGDYAYYNSSSGSSVGFGTHVGYVYTGSGSYSGVWLGAPSLYHSTGAVQFNQRIGSTRL